MSGSADGAFSSTEEGCVGEESVMEYVPNSVTTSGSEKQDLGARSETPSLPDNGIGGQPDEWPSEPSSEEPDPSPSSICQICLNKFASPPATIFDEDRPLFEKVQHFVAIILAEKERKCDHTGIDLNKYPKED